MGKAAVSVMADKVLGLLALLVLLCLAFVLNHLFIIPGDGGSGIGGTGRFGGESGLGGTGGPVTNLGALGEDRKGNEGKDKDKESPGADGRVGTELARMGEAPPTTSNTSDSVDVQVDVAKLRLSPEPVALPSPALLRRTARAEHPLEESLRANSQQTLQQLKQVDTEAWTREQESQIARTLAADLTSAANSVVISSLEVTRQLMLAETSTELELAAENRQDNAFSLLRDEADHEERRRLQLPVRPERPDRPSLPRRSAPNRGSIPTPPVRPLRI